MSLESVLIPAVVFVVVFGVLVALLWKSIRSSSGETSASSFVSAVPWAPAGAVCAVLIAIGVLIGTLSKEEPAEVSNLTPLRGRESFVRFAYRADPERGPMVVLRSSF